MTEASVRPSSMQPGAQGPARGQDCRRGRRPGRLRHGRTLFLGQHVLTSRLGVAVQVNAFNFPVWGMLETLAPALLAGVPSIVKPATPTAYLAEYAVRIMLEADVLPEGALQLICGSIPGVLDALDGQDSVGFTGSAATAGRLRGHPAVTGRSVRFTAEADSLNRSIPGPDAALEARSRSVRRPARHRDDHQSRPEVHGHPSCVRAADQA